MARWAEAGGKGMLPPSVKEQVGRGVGSGVTRSGGNDGGVGITLTPSLWSLSTHKHMLTHVYVCHVSCILLTRFGAYRL